VIHDIQPPFSGYDFKEDPKSIQSSIEVSAPIYPEAFCRNTVLFCYNCLIKRIIIFHAWEDASVELSLEEAYTEDGIYEYNEATDYHSIGNSW